MKDNAVVVYPTDTLNQEGKIEITDIDIIFYKKSKAVRAMFGAIGSALSEGKEAFRFSFNDIDKIEMKRYLLRKKGCYITLSNGQTYIFIFSSPDSTYEFLKTKFDAFCQTDK